MKILILSFFLLIVLSVQVNCQQLLVVEGYYLDKKNNPMSDKTVEFERDGGIIGSNITDEEGYFKMDIIYVGLERPIWIVAKKENLLHNYPNPFRYQTTIITTINEPGILSIYNIQGKLFSWVDLNRAGYYEINWGGMGSKPGIYILHLLTDNLVCSKKIIQKKSGGTGFKIKTIEENRSDNQKSMRYIGDSISFSGNNSTNIKYQFELLGDTLFYQTGNVGPKITQYVQDITAEIDDILQWNMFDYHYNDDLSELTTGVTGASIVGDSIYQFTVTESGVFQQIVHMIDPEDGTLEKIMAWDVYVDQSQIPPDANTDFYYPFEDDQNFPSDVTENDVDLDGTIETVEIITPLTRGNSSITDLIIFSDFDADYNGLDSLKYRITDNDGLTDEAWAYFDIQPVDDAPFPTGPFNTTYTLSEDDSLMITVRPNHYDDVDTEYLTYIFNNLMNAIGSQPDGLTAKIKPTSNWNGTITGVSIDAYDGNSTATSNAFDIVVTPVNDAPFPTGPFNTTYTIAEDDSLMITIKPNHYDDIDTDPLTFPINNLANAVGSQPDDVTIKIKPNANWNGTITGVGVDAFDGEYTATSNAFDIVVTPADDEPVQTGDIPTQTSDEDQEGQLDLSPYYSHADGDVITITDITGLPVGSTYDVTQDQASITFPNHYNTEEYSTIDNVVVTAEDSDGDPITFNGFEWVLNAVQDQIAVNDDNYSSIPYDTPTLLNVTINDTDVDLLGGVDLSSLNVVTPPEHASFQVISGQVEVSSTVSGLDSLEYYLEDTGYPLPATSGTAWAYFFIETQGNVDPEFPSGLPDKDVDEDRSLPHILFSDLNDYGFDANGDDLTYTIISQTNSSLANVDISGIELILDFLDLNQYGTSIIGVEADDGNGGTATAYFTLTVDAVNDVIVVNDDSYLSIPYGTTVTLQPLLNDDDDADGGEGGVNAGSLNIITPAENGGTTILAGEIDYVPGISGPDSLEYEVSDTGYPLPPTTKSAWIHLFVEEQGNQDPTIDLPDKDVDEDRSVPYTLFNNLDDFSFDGDGDDLTYSVASQTNTTLANVEIQSLTQLILTYLQPDGSGTSTIGVEADDGNGGTAIGYFELTVDPMADITLQAKWLMTDALIPGATLHIGSNQYTLTSGTINMQVAPGTSEVNVTHPNSIDGTSIWEEYTIIQTPGQNANVEQRAGGDPNSPVTFGTADMTLQIYKIKNDFNMFSVAQAIGTGPNGETIRFAWNPDNPFAYFDESGTNQTPNSTTITRVQDGIAEIASATLGKLDMVYGQGTNPPGTPYLELAINSTYPTTNGTTWDGSYEILTSFAHWPSNMNTQVIWTEMIQAVQNQVDVGQSLTFLNGSTWEISDFGKSCLRFGYNFDPGTYFVTPAARGQIEKEK